MKIKEIFCTKEQQVTNHVLSVDGIGEIIATCPCGHFLKLPAGLTVKEAEGLIKEHETVNKMNEEQLAKEENRQASQALVDAIGNDAVKEVISTEEPIESPVVEADIVDEKA